MSDENKCDKGEKAGLPSYTERKKKIKKKHCFIVRRLFRRLARLGAKKKK